ncbi:uncharacterized protein LOC132205754 isoform X2 [Neocloeon triangulifer]|uniref:uncharacterized protein LOC132205754 isoform X2 n=1 Tax=Neocloeon triangulifer TaxID=2078957 RepID=UPI00286F2FE7|nr:uncharacterized protein LOC132205754 isoform X2 [Neocloeon triangulifer]
MSIVYRAEVVCDSILENKEVTKSYWEERMMTLSTEDVFRPAEEQQQPEVAADAESRIAVELREMREREEELKQLRQRISSGNLLDSMATDEGNCSEYSSEENKELGSSRVMSPEVPLQRPFGHHRTQSMDSMSSGHSSGSGGPNDSSLPVLPVRRRITVKPLDEPEDDESTYLKSRLNETPIEREIRLAAEREEELKREKGTVAVPPVTPKTPTEQKLVVKPAIANDSRDVQHRIATSRIQQEIMEATQREKDLIADGKIVTLSEDTVDSKVTRFTELAEYAMAEQQKQQVANKSTAEIKRVVRPVAVAPAPSPVRSTPPPLNKARSFDGSGQRGLMQRFLASKGNLVFGNATPGTAFAVESPVFSLPIRREPAFELEPEPKEAKMPPSTPIRKGFTSAGDKIQEELTQMKKREDELKLQRAHILAQSQPNLLDLLDHEAAEPTETEEEVEEEPRRDVATLSKALSNPNLLDSSSYPETSNRTAVRKRSALIDQWESLIQKNSQQV